MPGWRKERPRFTVHICYTALDPLYYTWWTLNLADGPARSESNRIPNQLITNEAQHNATNASNESSRSSALEPPASLSDQTPSPPNFNYR